jgi:hypothetical protein
MLTTVPYVRDLTDARAFIRKSASGGMSPYQLADEVRVRWPAIPVDFSVPADAPKARDRSRVDDILSMVATGAGTAAPEPARQEGPAAWAAAIDGVLAAIMRAVFSDANFRTFEAAWRVSSSLAKEDRRAPRRTPAFPSSAPPARRSPRPLMPLPPISPRTRRSLSSST